MVIDFTDLPQTNKGYGGANGGKRGCFYNGAKYMIKFPSAQTINEKMSYTNGCISEYLGCHVYEIIGIPVQETLLGIYKVNGKDKIVCACKDFTLPGVSLNDFAAQKNTVIDSPHGGYGTEFDSVIEAIENIGNVNTKEILDRFWDMFIVDALIGNWDRHNGNWGMLYNEMDNSLSLAPVYDCGSSFYPQADETIMRKTLEDENERKLRVYEIPTSAIKINNKRINYFDFISSLKCKECNDALKRILPRVDINKINSMIDETPFITDIQKKFYKAMLTERKERILDYSFELLIQKEQATSKN